MSDSLTRVEKSFIFNFLKLNKIKINLKTPFSGTDATILDFNNNELLVELEKIPEEFNEYKQDLQAFFYFQNNYHVFNSHIIKMQGKNAVIKNPDNVAKNLKRKHERIIVDGKYKTLLKLEGPILPLDYPKSAMFYYSEKPPMNADFTGVNIQEILSKFKSKMENFVSSNKIQMMRNYTPANFLEKLAIHTGKIVFIPNIKTEIVIKTGSDIPANICTKRDWIDFEKINNGTDDIQMNKAISNYMVSLKDVGVHSIAVFPVLYKNYVVALITLINDYKKSKIIDYNVIKYSDQFSRILSYSLKYSGYFKAEEGEKESYETGIFDISPGGLSIVSDDPDVEEKLQLDKNIDMVLSIDGRQIEVMAKLVRKHEKLLHKFFGFSFIDISSDNYDFIEQKFTMK